MAEERTLATARAADETGDEEVTKEELQRRMEEARETITQTVTEIKDTVANQYQSVKETINETLDWREQFRKRPVAWSVGALSVGFVVGYGLAAAFKGDERSGYPSYEETDMWNLGTAAGSRAASGADGVLRPATRSYASQAITGGSYGSTEYAGAEMDEAASTPIPAQSSSSSSSASGGGTSSASMSGGDESTAAAKQEQEEPSGPSLFDRFKETKAFDRLQDEVSKLGDRFIEQLSTVGQEVVLPALFGKIRELFGVDLSDQQQQGRGAQGGRMQGATAGGASSSSSSLADASRGGSGGSQAGAASDMGGLSYGTSENRGYGTGTSDSSARDDYGRSPSVADVGNAQ